MSIFPDEDVEIIEEVEETDELPAFREYAYDIDTGDIEYENGLPKVVEGLEAVKIWAYMALRTQKYEYGAYSHDYGNTFEALLGTVYSDKELNNKASEMVEECLLACPYIESISNVDAVRTGKGIAITAVLNTVYGEVELIV